MNNGLNGRYGKGLESWNNARRFAAEVSAAYSDSDTTVAGVVDKWNLERQDVMIPDPSKLKRMASGVIFLGGRDSVDTIAQKIMTWTGWFAVENPNEYQHIEGAGTNSCSKVTA